MPGTVASLLDRWGVPAAWLQVEITETAMLLDPTRALETLSRLRQLGVRVALDDFGAGYSSLVRLKRLPADTLKIDRSLIADIDVDERALAIVRSTIDLGHRLGLQVVAEGVENRGTNALLQTLGCDLVQGFYLSPPLPAQSFVRWLRLIREATTRRLMAEPR